MSSQTKNHSTKVYAVDFDGTLCQNAYPKIGEPKHNVIDFVKKLQKDGHRLILWTCREGDQLSEAVNFCSTQGLFFDAINSNLEDRIAEYGGDPRKVGADFYIDDLSIHPDTI